MDGYRYWVERHRLCVDLDREKERIATLPESERTEQTLIVERDFRIKLDALYARAQGNFEGAPPSAKA
jgi:hypothetical protein